MSTVFESRLLHQAPYCFIMRCCCVTVSTSCRLFHNYGKFFIFFSWWYTHHAWPSCLIGSSFERNSFHRNRHTKLLIIHLFPIRVMHNVFEISAPNVCDWNLTVVWFDTLELRGKIAAKDVVHSYLKKCVFIYEKNSTCIHLFWILSIPSHRGDQLVLTLHDQKKRSVNKMRSRKQ